MKFWLMRIPRWMPKTTNIYLEYATLLLFPVQQWLQKLTSMLPHSTVCVFYISS
jgi:hypothetical protein